MMKKSFKQRVVRIPGLGYTARVASKVVSLPKLEEELIKERQRNIEADNTQNRRIEELSSQLDNIQDNMASLQQTLDSLRASVKQAGSSVTSPSIQSGEELFADDHLMDRFYTSFEDKFRGSEEMIMERQKEYLPYFKNSKLDFKKTPVLDIGSGRGEFIQLLKSNKIKSVGLDINIDMVERSKKKGLDAVQGDALSYLQESKSKTFGAITGFHIVEHIPFNILMRIFSNALRTLVKDGFVIFETPNPENVVVGTHNFYMDPSHLHPLPPVMLAFSLENVGFKKVEILRLHPDTSANPGSLPEDIANRFYGPRDYAVIGYK